MTSAAVHPSAAAPKSAVTPAAFIAASKVGSPLTRLVAESTPSAAVPARPRIDSSAQPLETYTVGSQFVVLPILVPFFFLVYTDVLALALVLGATLSAFAGRHWLAAGILGADIFVRQTDVVWTGLLPLI